MDRNILRNIKNLKKSNVGTAQKFSIDNDEPCVIYQWLIYDKTLQGYFYNFDFFQYDNFLAIFPKNTDEKMVIDLFTLKVLLYSNSKKDYSYSYDKETECVIGLEGDNEIYIYALNSKIKNYFKEKNGFTVSLKDDILKYASIENIANEAEVYKNTIWRNVNIPKKYNI